MFRRVPSSIARLGKSMSVHVSRNFQGYSVKCLLCLARAHAHLTVCVPLEREIDNTLCCTVGHTGTGTRQLVRTPGERRPLRLYLRGYSGKPTRLHQEPLGFIPGSVSVVPLVASEIPGLHRHIDSCLLQLVVCGNENKNHDITSANAED